MYVGIAKFNAIAFIPLYSFHVSYFLHLFPYYLPVYSIFQLIWNGKNVPLWSCSFLYSPSIIGATLVGLLQARKADSHIGRKDTNQFRFLHSCHIFKLAILTKFFGDFMQTFVCFYDIQPIYQQPFWYCDLVPCLCMFLKYWNIKNILQFESFFIIVLSGCCYYKLFQTFFNYYKILTS